MREVVSIYLGQAGNQIGERCWELYCLEHGVDKEGRKMSHEVDAGSHVFFRESTSNFYVPRALWIDLDSGVIDSLRTGEYSKLFHPNQLISGKEDAANNFARGRYSVGKEMKETMDEYIRRECEYCDNVLGFMVHHSFGGGTGSGLGSLLFEDLQRDYSKKNRLDVAVYPAPQVSTAVVEPYNAVLATNSTVDTVDCTFIVDNEAIYDICKKKLDIPRPTYTYLNRIIAQVVSSITSSLRFSGLSNVDLTEFQTNLVPYPKLHYPVVAYSPICSREKLAKDTISPLEMTLDCLVRDSQMVKCNPSQGLYMTCCLLYRGNLTDYEVKNSLSNPKVKNSVRRVSWCPTTFKTGINNSRPVVVEGSMMGESERALCTLSNNTVIVEAWKRLETKYDLMYSKRAFVHWYVGEGMEEGEFSEARASLSDIIKEYESIMREDVDDTNLSNFS